MPLPPIDPNVGERQTLDEIREWHRGIIEAIVDQRGAVLHAMRNGTQVAARFLGLNQTDLDVYFDAQRRELDRLTILNLVASVEATLKDDFFHRVKRRLNDSLSLKYRRWYRGLPTSKRRRPDFDERGLLDLLKDARVVNNHLIGAYRECLRQRHWVGHGRNWNTPVEIHRLDPDDVFDRCKALVMAIP